MSEFSFLEVGKSLEISNVRLLRILRENAILFKSRGNNLPYQKYIDNGWFKVIKLQKKHGDETFHFFRVLITEKGLPFIESIVKARKEYEESVFKNKVKIQCYGVLSKLGVQYDRFRMVLITEPDSGNTTQHYQMNGEYYPIITYNKKNRNIIKIYEY